jgi:hypothetical protein
MTTVPPLTENTGKMAVDGRAIKAGGITQILIDGNVIARIIVEERMFYVFL